MVTITLLNKGLTWNLYTTRYYWHMSAIFNIWSYFNIRKSISSNVQMIYLWRPSPTSILKKPPIFTGEPTSLDILSNSVCKSLTWLSIQNWTILCISYLKNSTSEYKLSCKNTYNTSNNLEPNIHGISGFSSCHEGKTPYFCCPRLQRSSLVC